MIYQVFVFDRNFASFNNMFDYKKLNIVKINLIKNRFIRKQSAYESSTSILCSHY